MAPGLACNTEGSMNPDLDTDMRFWCDLLGVTPANGWTIKWGWVDDIPGPNGVSAYGQNHVNGETQESLITVRRLQTQRDIDEYNDTLAHEVSHCIGARMEALLDAGKNTEAHEYMAETYAPALVKLRGTPKAKSLAKAFMKLPERAKGSITMPEDIASLEKAMLEARLAGDTAKVTELFDKWIAAKVSAQAAPIPEAVPVAKPIEAPAPPLPGPQDDLGMKDEEKLAKNPLFKKAMNSAIDAILDAYTHLSAEAKAFAKDLGTPEKVRAYLKTIPQKVAEDKPKETPMGLGAVPRGGNGAPKTNAPSTDAALNSLFKIAPEDDGGDGVQVRPEPGKLITFSVMSAFKATKKYTLAKFAIDKAKMVGAQ